MVPWHLTGSQAAPPGEQMPLALYAPPESRSALTMFGLNSRMRGREGFGMDVQWTSRRRALAELRSASGEPWSE